MNPRTLTMTALGAIVAATALAGCSPRDQTDAKNGTADTAARTGQTSREAGNELAKGAGSAKDAIETASTRIGEKVDDAVITTSVKAELAKDSKLSALKINVDTDNGRVALRGTAPSNEARAHATTLAMNVKGVTSVDNRLKVEPGKT